MKKQFMQLEESNDLHVNIETVSGKELINTGATTVLNVSMNANGDISTSFFGSYNKQILDYLFKINKKHLSLLRKKLLKNEKIDIEAELKKLTNKNKVTKTEEVAESKSAENPAENKKTKSTAQKPKQTATKKASTAKKQTSKKITTNKQK